MDVLSHIDSSVLCGHESLCSVWTTILADVLTSTKVDPARVLLACKINPVTSQAKQFMKDVTKAKVDGDKEEEDADPTVSFFSVKDMFEFGCADDAPPADVLASLRVAIEGRLLEEARLREDDNRKSLMVMVTLAQDAKQRAQTHHELLWRADCTRQVLLNDAQEQGHDVSRLGGVLAKPPENLKLPFFGTVGFLSRHSQQVLVPVWLLMLNIC